MTIKKPTIIPPIAGWKEKTYYAVEVSFNPANPCFGAIFYTGFLNGNDGEPGAYNFICGGGIDPKELANYRDVVFMRSILPLITGSELETLPNMYKLPSNHSKDPFDLEPEPRINWDEKE